MTDSACCATAIVEAILARCDRLLPKTLLTRMQYCRWNFNQGVSTNGIASNLFGEQSALISNQHVVYARRPEARSRLNTLFMSGMFVRRTLQMYEAWHGIQAN